MLDLFNPYQMILTIAWVVYAVIVLHPQDSATTYDRGLGTDHDNVIESTVKNPK